MSLPGPWSFSLRGFGETLPDPNNRIRLSDKKDKNGLQQIEFDAGWGKNELKMREQSCKKL